MKQKQVLASIYKLLEGLINGYITLPELSSYIVNPGLGDLSGIIGSLFQAEQALHEKTHRES